MADYGICRAPDCGNPARNNPLRLCSKHEARMRRGGSLEPRKPKQSVPQLLGGRSIVGWWTILGEGEPYQRLTEDGRKHKDGPIRTARCRCVCGQERDIAIHTLKQGHSRQCGCLQSSFNEAVHLKHGEARREATTVEYRAWHKMRERCSNPKSKDWPNYGGRGISVCDRWLSSYESFLNDMGRRPPHHSIDRIDNDGNYEPSNCRWADHMTQARNRPSRKGIPRGLPTPR